MRSELIHKIFREPGIVDETLVLEIFRYQYQFNPLYQNFCHALGRLPGDVTELAQIPFLPISFFKSHTVKTGNYDPETWFESSGTTQTKNSRHWLRSLDLYRESFVKGFNLFYGNPQNWCIIGLLPAYLERQHSSLVVMVDELVRLSKHPSSGFYLYNHAELKDKLIALELAGQKVLLIGVTFALLDFADAYPLLLEHTTIMETGGMKGRRQEITRSELHNQLKLAFGIAPIHSEYGMTELLSQAYAGDNGLFYTPPWMKVLLRELEDPLSTGVNNGAINIIDLANLDSCCFIATDDMARIYPDGGFEVLGRIDNSDIRGCSLMSL